MIWYDTARPPIASGFCVGNLVNPLDASDDNSSPMDGVASNAPAHDNTPSPYIAHRFLVSGLQITGNSLIEECIIEREAQTMPACKSLNGSLYRPVSEPHRWGALPLFSRRDNGRIALFCLKPD